MIRMWNTKSWRRPTSSSYGRCMFLVDTPIAPTPLPRTHPPLTRDEHSAAPERTTITPSDNGMSSVMTLRNGASLRLTGITRGMVYPPNYLEDLRAGTF